MIKSFLSTKPRVTLGGNPKKTNLQSKLSLSRVKLESAHSLGKMTAYKKIKAKRITGRILLLIRNFKMILSIKKVKASFLQFLRIQAIKRKARPQKTTIKAICLRSKMKKTILKLWRSRRSGSKLTTLEMNWRHFTKQGLCQKRISRR